MAPDPFDFDYWRDLAARDPSAFFKARAQAIEAYISEHREAEAGLRRLQNRIDTMRAVAGTPAQALAGFAAMIAESAATLGRELERLKHELDAR